MEGKCRLWRGEGRLPAGEAAEEEEKCEECLRIRII